MSFFLAVLWGDGSSIAWSLARPNVLTGVRTMFLAAVVLIVGVAGQDPSKKPLFLYPPYGSNNIYNKMDTVMVTYSSHYDTAMLYTFCQPGVGKYIYEQRAPGFNASVPVLLNFTSDTPCWFNVRTGPNGIDGENSATFNLLGEERSTGRKTFGPLDISEISSSSSLAPSSPAPSLSPSPSSPSSTDGVSGPAATDDSNDGESSSSTTSTPNSSQDTSSARGSLSAGASAGVGIGAGIGVIAVAAVACWYLRRRRNTAGMEISGGQHPHSGGGGGDGSRMEQYFYTGPAGPKWKYGGEFGAVHRPVEIATSGPNGSRTHHEMMA